MRRPVTIATAIVVFLTTVTVPAQAAAPYPLEADGAQAARTCFTASITAFNTAADGQLAAITADATWFAVEAVSRQVGPAETFLKRVEAISSEKHPAQAAIFDNPAPVLAACAARWPMSRRGGSVIKLPADTFEREVLCVSVSSLIQGMAQAEEEDYGYSTLSGPTETIKTRALKILTDAEMAKRGMKGLPQIQARFGKALVEAHLLGNFNSVLTACA